MKLPNGDQCACGEETDPNLVLHMKPADGMCRIRPKRLQPGDPDYTVGWEKPAKSPLFAGNPCQQCGVDKAFHFPVKDSIEGRDTEPLWVCPGSTFKAY